jgi:putative serine protease PepD
MTTTYDPFTPAGTPEERGQGGRRRAEDRGGAWDGPPAGKPHVAGNRRRQPDRRGSDGGVRADGAGWREDADELRWVDDARRIGDGGGPDGGGRARDAGRAGGGGWADDAGRADGGGRAGAAMGVDGDGWGGDSGRADRPRWDDDPRWGEDDTARRTEPDDPWGALHPAAAGRDRLSRGSERGWGQPSAPAREPLWTDDPRWVGEQPREARLGPARSAPVPGYADPEPGPQPRPATAGSRVRLVVTGLVVALLLVATWQAYRIEGMDRDNHDLATVLTAQKDRTDRLEKQLAGVFDPEAVSSSVLPSVFRVRAGDFTGTAFAVGTKAADGQSNLLTNYHVIESVFSGGGRKVSLERGQTRITATIVKVSKGRDLALLRADQKITGLATAGAQVKPGQQVVVVGAPLGLDDTVTTGVISAYRPDDVEGPTIQFDAPINPGNSGGPVVNANEQVVGLATAKAKDAEGIGLAIPIRTACQTFSVC